MRQLYKAYVTPVINYTSTAALIRVLSTFRTVTIATLNIKQKEAFLEIEIKSDREIAIERAEAVRSIVDIVVYSDTSGREDHLDTTAAILNNSLETSDSIQV
ncbi:unnamed protein product [Penicillium camemberti]|uniref:Str. FM013 n=1 Tax=Penicillium camemberti (strain FM 013) TaxID=1429867 RepID=A0A0G4PUU7_PENC3|nr:unnamed protein product [Penicillium camemberti]